MKNKKPIIALGALAVLGLIGGTIAYFTSEATFDNVFTTAVYKTKSTEVFNAPDNWLPGDTVTKTVTTTNEGTIPVAVRVSTSEKWTLDDTNHTEITMPHTFDMGTPETTDDVIYQSDRDLVTLNYNASKGTKWLESTDTTSDKHLYYYKKLAAGASTETSFLDSVTLKANVATDTKCVTEGTQGQGTVTKTCTTGIKGLGKATYTLTVTVETVQADQYRAAWGETAPAIAD